MKKRKKKPTPIVKKRNKRPKQQREWGRIVFLIAIICFVFLFWSKLHDPNILPITVVAFDEDYEHVDKNKLTQLLQPSKHQSNFFTVNLTELKEQLLQNAWIKSVSICKEWPNQLHVHIQEQQPIALWNNDALLNDDVQVFAANRNNLTPALPQLKGAAGSQQLVWRTYKTLGGILAPTKLTIKVCELSSQGTWSLELNNGLRLILGQENIETRLKRFIKAYPEVAARNPSIEYIDLRYDHGMAVKSIKVPASQLNEAPLRS